MLNKDQYSNESRLTSEQSLPLNLDKLRGRSFSDYLDGSIIVMVAVLFVAMIFTYLVQIIFDGEINWKDIGVNTLLLAACTIAIYLLLRSYAQRKGRRTEAWEKAYTRLQECGKSIIDKNYARLVPKYCREWEDEHLDADIEAVLLPVGLTLKEYKDKYCQYSKRELKGKFMSDTVEGGNTAEGTLTEYQLKAVIRAKRIRRAHFDERYFFVNQSGGSKWRRRSPSSGLSTQTINRIDTARIIFSSLIVSLMSASLFMDIIIDFSKESVIKCVFKLAVTIFFGAVGMISGYSFTSIKEVAEMSARSDEIDTFKKWCEKNTSK